MCVRAFVQNQSVESHECRQPAARIAWLEALMAPFLQMRHSPRATSFVSALFLAVLSHAPSYVATQGIEGPVRDGYGSAVAPSGCTMDLGRKDLAPVFTSCRSVLICEAHM